MMKITRRQLRQIIKEAILLNEGNNIYVFEKDWMDGIFVEDESGEMIMPGEMISALLDAGDDDIFNSPQGVDEANLQKLLTARDRLSADPDEHDMELWDNKVFEDFYNVDLMRVVRLYARRMNLNIVEKETETLPKEKLSPEDEAAARDEFEFESFYS